jgi:hypothetical protein
MRRNTILLREAPYLGPNPSHREISVLFLYYGKNGNKLAKTLH